MNKNKKKELLKLMPEFDLIGDNQLREKALAVWAEAMQSQGWTAEDLVSMPFTLSAENVTTSLPEHVRTVCQICVACDKVLTDAYRGRKTPVNRDHLIAGALLHDVGKLYEYEKRDGKIVKSKHGEYLRHPFSGVGLCFKHNIDEEVMHIVGVHSKEGDHVKRSPEAIILHHADFMDFDLARFA
jgi:putative nucleotidyltransferase with HDIG domain